MTVLTSSITVATQRLVTVQVTATVAVLAQHGQPEGDLPRLRRDAETCRAGTVGSDAGDVTVTVTASYRLSGSVVRHREGHHDRDPGGGPGPVT